MPSPVFNEQTMRSASTTWAPPEPGTMVPPMNDGPVSTWRPQVMTVNGAISATATLLVLFLATATVGWLMSDPIAVDPVDGSAQYGIPMLAWGGLIVGVALTFLLMFKPHLAKFVAPIYALAEGLFVGALSRAYEGEWNGIVVQAAGATIAVFLTMLVLYRLRIIRVTERFRTVVTAATIGVMVFYGISFLIRLFAGADSVSFLSSSNMLGIGFSILVAGIAAFNLALDFDFIERGSQQGLDKDFEWYAAFGLLVTIIWLYLELLRLLAKLRER
jgi:uncharacterized YccA/Bax inhibitor family protein